MATDKKQDYIDQMYRDILGAQYDKIKSLRDENGYYSVSVVHFATYKLQAIVHVNGDETWRLKTLDGIEHNNEWIVINSYDDLPVIGNELDYYWVCENGVPKPYPVSFQLLHQAATMVRLSHYCKIENKLNSPPKF